MKNQPVSKRLAVALSVGSVFLVVIAASQTAMAGDGTCSTSTRVRDRKPTDVEIRFEFYPTGAHDDSVVPIFMVVGKDGRAEALRYYLRDQTKNIASYKGVLPQAEVQRLFDRVRAAFRLPRHRKDYDRRLIYESDGFYLALKQQAAKVKEMFGGLETRPEEVRALIADMRELWKQLNEVPPAFAYMTSRPVEKDRLRRLKREGPSRLTSIESLPATLQSLLIPVVTQPLNFYPLTQEQYNDIQTYKQPMTYKAAGYELILILAAKENRTHKIRVKQYEDPTASRKEQPHPRNYPQHSVFDCRGNSDCRNR